MLRTPANANLFCGALLRRAYACPLRRAASVRSIHVVLQEGGAQPRRLGDARFRRFQCVRPQLYCDTRAFNRAAFNSFLIAEIAMSGTHSTAGARRALQALSKVLFHH